MFTRLHNYIFASLASKILHIDKLARDCTRYILALGTGSRYAVTLHARASALNPASV